MKKNKNKNKTKHNTTQHNTTQQNDTNTTQQQSRITKQVETWKTAKRIRFLHLHHLNFISFHPYIYLYKKLGGDMTRGCCSFIALLLLLVFVVEHARAAKSTTQKTFVNLPPEWSGWVISNDTQTTTTSTPSGRIYFNWDINMKRVDSQLVTNGADWQTSIWDYNTGVVTTLTPDGSCRQSPLLKAPGLPESLYTPEIKSKFVNYTGNDSYYYSCYLFYSLML